VPKKVEGSALSVPGTKGKSSAQSVVMEELRDLSLTVRVDAKELDFEPLRMALSKKYQSQTREDGWGVRIIAREDEEVRPMHSHIALDRNEDTKAFTLEYDVVRGDHPAIRKYTTATAFTKALRTSLKNPERPRPGLLSANFALSSEKWEPTFPVPFPHPGAMTAIPGLPQVIGLDLAFSEQGPTQPLIRVFVTTYPELQQIIVRVLLRCETDLCGPIAPGLIEAAQTTLPAFVIPRRDLAP